MTEWQYFQGIVSTQLPCNPGVPGVPGGPGGPGGQTMTMKYKEKW